jgi:glycosyltransferase involved in cell wall biosynthesis
MANSEVLLSVIVPVFNEAQTIGNVILGLKTVLQGQVLGYEIIVVDDGSTDKSAEIAKNQGAKILSSKTHMGKGYAMRLGFSKARGEITATMDSDGSHNPEELTLLLAPIIEGQADLVIGSRLFLRKPASGRALNESGIRLFNLLIKVFTGISVSDSQSGYRVLTSKVLKSLSLKSVEYEIESEMLVKAARKNFRIKEVPVTYVQRTYGKSRLDPYRDGFKIFLSILLAYTKG